MEHKIIGIRADGSAQIGMGHLMRCMSVATALKEYGAEVVFITKNEQSRAFVTEKGFSCTLISDHCRAMEEEVGETLHIISENRLSLLLVDSYQAAVPYLAEINKYIPVVYMDDLGRMDLPVSGLINYNIYGQSMGYEKCYSGKTKLLLGSRYAPVKPEFLQTPYHIREKVQNILITMGGSDALNIAGRLGERLDALLPENIQITLICGRFSPHLKGVQKLAQKSSRICVLTDVADMWNQMAQSDIAVAAAGSTMYELCTMGVPTICCYYVENQRRIAEGFGTQTCMLNAGDFSKHSEAVLQRIQDETIRFIEDSALRTALSKQMKEVSDGRGAFRIAQSLCDYL